MGKNGFFVCLLPFAFQRWGWRVYRMCIEIHKLSLRWLRIHGLPRQLEVKKTNWGHNEDYQGALYSTVLFAVGQEQGCWCFTWSIRHKWHLLSYIGYHKLFLLLFKLCLTISQLKEFFVDSRGFLPSGPKLLKTIFWLIEAPKDNWQKW
jgi:hypothetical protein